MYFAALSVEQLAAQTHEETETTQAIGGSAPLRGSLLPSSGTQGNTTQRIQTISAMISSAEVSSPVLTRRFGSDAGSGAGKTGFNSQARAFAVEDDLVLNQSEGIETVLRRAPLRRLRTEEENPFAPPGIKLGAFRFFPMVEIMGGYDDNPLLNSSNRKPSPFGTIASAIRFESDWVRHRLNGEIGGAYTDFARSGIASRPTGFARIDGVLDVLRDTRIEMQASATTDRESPNSPDLPLGLANSPQITAADASVGVVQTLGKAEVGLKVDAGRSEYEQGRLRNGALVNNKDRNVTRTGLELMTGYEIMPGIRPFLAARIDHRSFDQTFDDYGYRRDSDGASMRAGARFALTSLLSGQVAVGYGQRKYDDARLGSVKGLIADANLAWRMTGLTTLTAAASSEIDDSTLTGISGVTRKAASIQIDHAFRRYLIATARFGMALESYEGSAREDTRTSARLGLTYHLNRTASIRGEYRYEHLRSNIPGYSYNNNIALLGVRFER